MAQKNNRAQDELGPDSAGQSGDIQGLPGRPTADSESIEELVEEGNAFEAEVIAGVEGAKRPDEGEITTREVREDDIPPEYRNESEDEAA